MFDFEAGLPVLIAVGREYPARPRGGFVIFAVSAAYLAGHIPQVLRCRD